MRRSKNAARRTARGLAARFRTRRLRSTDAIMVLTLTEMGVGHAFTRTGRHERETAGGTRD